MAKIELFEKDLQVAASFFKVLGHPARLAILQYLSEARVCISGDISNELPLSRTTVNQHLKELKDVGIIKGEISGAKVNYCLDTEKINQMKEIMNKFMAGIDVSFYLECG
jgi:ArsR family transcriptional regulator, arsenate/arsenite/antimonite-responsive transcriptional repressor